MEEGKGCKAMYKIVYDDGFSNMLVAMDLTEKQCERLIAKQEKPEFYHIRKQELVS